MAIKNPKEARTRYYAIDGIRFCAALSVAIYHLFFGAWASPTSDIGRISQGAARFEAVAPYTWFLFISVEILFVISGLVIAYSANGSSTSKFVKGRLLRLYPAPWICAPITFVMICFIAPEQIYGLGEALTRLFNSLLLVPVKGLRTAAAPQSTPPLCRRRSTIRTWRRSIAQQPGSSAAAPQVSPSAPRGRT